MIIAHKLNKNQLNRISEICMGIGHIALASLAIPAIIDRFDFKMLTLSLVGTVFFWSISILLLRSK